MRKMIFGKRLKELREKRNLSQDQLAQLLKADELDVFKWESGAEVPEWETFKKIADFFHVPALYLMGMEKIDQTEIKKALQEVEITWGGKKLTEEQQQECRDLLEEIILEKMAEERQKVM